MSRSLSTQDYISIGQASKLLNMSIDTIRYYEKIDLIPHLQRRESGYRKLGFNDLLHLKGIAYLRQCGLSIDEIKNIYNDPMSKKQAINRALDELDRQIQALQASKQFLKEAKAELKAFESGKRGYFVERLSGGFIPNQAQDLSIQDYLNLDDLAFIIPTEEKGLEIVEGQFHQDHSNMAECFKDQPCLSKSFEFFDEDDIEKEIYSLIKQAIKAGYNIKSRILLTIHGKASCFMKTSLAGKLYLEIEKEDGPDAN